MAQSIACLFEASRIGKVVRTERDDPHGKKYVVEGRYVVEGVAVDENVPVGVVGRFTETGRFLIITVYEIIGRED